MATISDSNLLSQSPYLYLQGAGSDRSDNSAEGVHLRWDFNSSLAAVHIPKGNLAAQGSEYHSTAGFNKENDFVKIYRTSYNRNFPIIIDFTTMAPSQIIDGDYQVKTWRYNNVVAIPALPSNMCQVFIRFANPIKYNQAKQLYNPATDRLNFLKSYDDIIEVEVEGRLMFSTYVQMQVIDQTQENITRIESISVDEKELFISNRKKYKSGGSSYLLKEDFDFLLQENGGFLELESFAGNSSESGRVMAENIQYIRFRGDNCFPTLLWLETYHDFLLGKNQLSDWTHLSELSLSINNDEVFTRLEVDGLIDDTWPKFVNGAKVNISNYKTRWNSNRVDDLRRGVVEYLQLSRDADNLKANNSPKDVEPEEGEDLQEFEFSYLDLLKLASLDYHVARMLGFGYIDTSIPQNAINEKYIYIAVYETIAALDDLPSELRTHTYMTLPVGKTDHKLPVTPELMPLEYRLQLNNDTEIPISFTNDKGYSKYDNRRTVRLHVKPFDSTKEMGYFFVPDEEYSYVDNTEPILFGIAYRRVGSSEWVKPEINNDSYFQDHNEINETIPVIRSTDVDSPIFTHFETKEGIHEYAVYGINWFSRVSPLSNVQHTDETIFPIRNTLVPPLNLGVQIIQKEDPLILTTRAEQTRLAAIETDDKTLVRLTFEWNDINASNYYYGKEAEFFFRTENLLLVRGRIRSVTDLGQGLYDIHTESYEIDSTTPAIVVSPIVPISKEGNFKGSFLMINDTQYQVQEVRQSHLPGEGAIFNIQSPENRQIIEPDNNNEHQLSNSPIVPQVGSRFAVAENISLYTSWETHLTQKVTLTKFSNYHEIYTDSEGAKTEIYIGGIFKKASIVEFLDVNNSGQTIPESKTGIYRITFNDYILVPHEDFPNVEWYKGTVRIKVLLSDGKEEMRTLEVWNIERNEDGSATPTLQLIVRDSTFDLSENSTYIPIPVGENIDVNYHPGYRVYFTAETGFGQSYILPAASEGNKQTLIACRSTDVVRGQKIASPLSTPAIISAQEIIEPLVPKLPKGALFATRPNFYGKASYTFDTEVIGGERTPYALLFYRSNEQSILDTLYKHDTVLLIQEDLSMIENDKFFSNRWSELVNVVTDETTNQFKDWSGYRFPNPDNDNFKIPNPNPNATPIYPFDASKAPGSKEIVAGTKEIFGAEKTYEDIVKLAINNAFLSLTEQPIIYRYLKEDYQTSDEKPVIRDSNGDLIMPGTENYNGSPMAVKLPAKNIVRFTDYTLDGASTSIIFYYAVEMNNTLAVSDRSPILGPIQLMNTAAPKAPEIRNFYVRTENAIMGDTPAVLFEINDYPEAEKISKILIYRALTSTDATTVRTMKLATTVNIGEPLVDDFSDLDFLPFGEALYYRLVAIRTINTKVIDANNSIYETEDVESYPSSLILANIIDVNNPESPELKYQADEITTDGLLKNVVIKWCPTTYNGTYYLYQMNNSGNWVELCKIVRENSPMQYTLSESLPKTDEEGNRIYHRFKVMVENSSGLLSLEERVLII